MLAFANTNTGDIIDYQDFKTMTTQDFGFDNPRVDELIALEKSGDISEDQVKELIKFARDEQGVLMNAKILASEIQNQFLMDQRPAKFEKYTTPGGKNYREVLLQLEKEDKFIPKEKATTLVNYRLSKRGYEPLDEDQARILNEGGVDAVRMLEDMQSRLGITLHIDEVFENSDKVYQSGHFDDPNVLVHARVTDRTGPNGEKILYVEEIQSDWHQSARKERDRYIKDEMTRKLPDIERQTTEELDRLGAVENTPANRALRKSILDDLTRKATEEFSKTVPKDMAYAKPMNMYQGVSADDLLWEHGDKMSILQKEWLRDYIGRWELDVDGTPAGQAAQDQLVKEYDNWINTNTLKGVPDAPFKSNSQELALKQILDMAAKEGYDKVAIAPGSEQIKRYNMNQYMDTLKGKKQATGLIDIFGFKDDRAVVSKTGIRAEELADYVGKEKAESILSQLNRPAPVNTASNELRGLVASLSQKYGDDFPITLREKLTPEELGQWDSLLEESRSWDKINRPSGEALKNEFMLKGQDLEMTTKEGAGKKKIYDEIIPNYLGKYAKKEFGSEPGEIDISTGSGKTYQQYLDEIVEDPYRYLDEDEIFEELNERAMDKANVRGFDFRGEDADTIFDQFISREGPFDEIWAEAEKDLYTQKAKELAAKDPGAVLKAFSVDVTPQMREKITGEGQKLFAAAPVVGVQAIPGMEQAPQQAAPEPEPEAEEMPMPLENGGKVGKVKSAAKAALKKAKFTEKELEDLSYLIHDKGHLAKQGKSIEALDRAIGEFSSDAPALYRGVYSSEISGSKLNPGEKIKLNKYSSFSERPDIASQFGDAKVVVELPKGGRGFNYMQQQIENLLDLKEKDPAAFNSVDGDYLIESLKEEAEWIMGSPEVVIKGTRKEGPLTIIESDFIIPEQEPKKFQSGGKVGNAAEAIRKILSPEKRKENLAKFIEKSEVKEPVYHAAKADVKKFSPKYRTELSNMGHHFGTAEQANARIQQYDFDSESPNIGKYHLNITKPLEVSHMASFAPDHLAEQMMDMNILDPQKYDSLAEKLNYDSLALGEELVKILKKEGYDGLKYSNEREGQGYSFVPFSPNQVKSGIGNIGAYDVNEADIGKKYGGPVGLQDGGMATPDSELEDDPFVRTVMNAARHYQAGKEIEAGQMGVSKGPVTVGVNAVNIIDPGTRDKIQAQALFAAYRDKLGGVDVNASVNRPAQAPDGFYQGNVMASTPVGPGRAMAGVSGYKSPQKTDVSGYNFGYEQKVGPGYASGMVFKPKDSRQDTRYDVQYTVPFQLGGPVGLQDGGRVGKTRAAAEKLLRVLHGSPTRVTPESGKAMDVTTEPSYAVKRGTDKMLGKSGPPMVNQFDIPAGRMLQFEEQYSPEDVALMRRYFNKLPQGQAMRGEEIFDAAQGRDAILEGIAKAGGFAGYERPNTGAVGKGQWFRVTEPEELVRKARGGLAQFSKPL